MILHWQQLSLYYGGELAAYEQHFAEAGETTYALLCCRFAPSHARVAPNRGTHAERRLLASPLWQQEIPMALQNWSPLQHTRIVVTLAINRSPCRVCADQLVQALSDLQWNLARRFEHARFILACRGAYRGRVSEEAGYYDQATTDGDLMRLADAGWELCVLQMADELAPSGRELLQALVRQVGRRSFITRLDD